MGYYREQWNEQLHTTKWLNLTLSCRRNAALYVCMIYQVQKQTNLLEHKPHEGKDFYYFKCLAQYMAHIILCLMNSYWMTLTISFRDIYVGIKKQRQTITIKVRLGLPLGTREEVRTGNKLTGRCLLKCWSFLDVGGDYRSVHFDLFLKPYLCFVYFLICSISQHNS